MSTSSTSRPRADRPSPADAGAGPAPVEGADPFRWVMLGGLCLLYFSFGLVAAQLAPLLGPIRGDLGMSRTAMGTALAAWPFVYMFVAIPAGWIVDRLGLRRSLTLGGTIIMCSAVLRASAQGFGTMWLGVAVFGFGGALVSVGAPKLVAQWFSQDQRRTAVGIYMASPAIGSILALTTANSVLMPAFDDNWRKVLLVHAGFVAVATTAWLVISGRAAAIGSAPTTGEADEAAPVAALHHFLPLLRIPRVWLALILGIGVFYVQHGLANWLPDLLGDSGWSSSASANLAAASTAAGAVAALTVPRRASPQRRGALLIALLLATATASGLVAVLDGGPQAVAVVGLGGARAAMPAIVLLVLMDAPGVHAANMGAATGLWFAFSEIGGVLGPHNIGAITDATGDFAAALMVLVVVQVALAIGVFATLGFGDGRPRRPAAAAG